MNKNVSAGKDLRSAVGKLICSVVAVTPPWRDVDITLGLLKYINHYCIAEIMNAIDLHTHTICTIHDHKFTFSLDSLKQYIAKRNIKILGITNHNTFDIDQYYSIQKSVDILIIPGIEVDLENGHLLLLCDPSEVTDFSERCGQVQNEIKDVTTSISLKRLLEIFNDLSRYIVIPHYDKKPPIPEVVIDQLRGVITAGEVASQKKFLACKKAPEELTPVLFSDIRFKTSLNEFSPRQTYIEMGEPSFGALKYILSDKSKVFLSNDTDKRNNYFDITKSGIKIASGLNVIIGERSSGKSYTLNNIESELSDSEQSVKYIRQFSLVQNDTQNEIAQYNDALRHEQRLFVDDYLKSFKSVVDDFLLLDFDQDLLTIDNYISSLIKNAQECARSDAFSKTRLFSEVLFPVESSDNIKSVIDAVILLLENEEYSNIISKHLAKDALRSLVIELISHAQSSKENQLKKIFANDLISSIRSELQRKTTSTAIHDIDLYKILINMKKKEKFADVVTTLKSNRVISRKSIQNFTIEVRGRPFTGAQELKNLSGKQVAFSTAFKLYENPYDYITALKGIGSLNSSSIYEFFLKIDYKVLNKFGHEVSGGERSEFRLLQEIQDALKYDILLIDEPESSFDNVFLMNEVNSLIKEISENMPVIIVTHNSTVGASIKPDYLIYTRRIIDADGVTYKIYGGHPTDKNLKSSDGDIFPSHLALMGCLEAGEPAYTQRRQSYEILKN